MEGATVNPNEVDRGEKHNIDILIRNNKDQAIIIENKIFANDSNKPESFELADPFLRYQLPRYYRKIASHENKRNEVVAIVYLTINGKPPEDFDKFPEEVKPLIHRKEHLSDIQNWLTACLELLKQDSDLKKAIQQYIQARREFLNDVHLAIDLRKVFAKYLGEGYKFIYENDIDFVENAAVLQNEFIHVKWHVVHEFYSLLKDKIKNTFGVGVADIDNEKITALTHRTGKTVTVTALTFDYNSQTFYVCNDKQGFSIGVNRDNKQNDDFKFLFRDKNYAFFDFKQIEVYNLIESAHRDDLINDIVSELVEFVSGKQDG
ncbi:PD-(D/E)XK nuclease family protein [Pedobacter helvus]|uniref:PD-(D/E)XK nuclease family protein n=1 Tax=Pedobacter helvus TaxID=2563444 RepID=A0ABW9JMP3_9SPHI|nr:PD-(D/E)XK nuclease family protein [Pedobacter ureilyticus]